MTDLAQHIRQIPIMDTHEHLHKEEHVTGSRPDPLVDLFDNYVTADLVVAGATPEAIQRLVDPSDPDLAARFAPVRDAWERCRHTGYGEAVRLIGAHFYGLEEITPAGLEAAAERSAAMRRPGARREILREFANLDHVQIDDFVWACVPDASGPEFFLYDLSWMNFCCGQIDAAALQKETGIDVCGLADLRAAMAALFDKYAPCAIAVKSQHAYSRTLLWQEREDADAERMLQRALAGQEPGQTERDCLGDWCLARGVELAIEHNLPFKIHTGYYAGHSRMPVERIRPGHLCALLNRYPRARFVLMHIAYPYQDELVALAKHYPNVYVDLCWAWSIDSYSTSDFVRRLIHAVPANKLFGFGGDSRWPATSAAYALQARAWLTRTLQGEVADGLLSEGEAMALATRFLRTNQEACFDLEGTREAIRALRADLTRTGERAA